MTGSDEHKTRFDAAKEEAFAWLMRLTSGEATAEDVDALERWRRRDPSNEAALIQASKLWHSVGPAVAQVAREAVPLRPGTYGFLAGKALRRRAFLGGAVAAVAAYSVVRPPFGLWPALSELASDYRTGTGEQRRVTIAGASVELNTKTSIDVTPTPGGADRIELIAGELAVATATDAARLVVVTAAGGQAATTNANFNIRYVGSSVCITCLAGSVRVEHGERAVTLKERQQVSYSSDGIGEAAAVDTEAVSSWRDGVLIFHNEPLSHVIDEVNRYRPGRIIIANSNLGQVLVTARFKLARLQDVITQVQETFGARVTRLPGDIVLLSS